MWKDYTTSPGKWQKLKLSKRSLFDLVLNGTEVSGGLAKWIFDGVGRTRPVPSQLVWRVVEVSALHFNDCDSVSGVNNDKIRFALP